jgi:hypothetical protein
MASKTTARPIRDHDADSYPEDTERRISEMQPPHVRVLAVITCWSGLSRLGDDDDTLDMSHELPSPPRCRAACMAKTEIVYDSMNSRSQNMK